MYFVPLTLKTGYEPGVTDKQPSFRRVNGFEFATLCNDLYEHSCHVALADKIGSNARLGAATATY